MNFVMKRLVSRCGREVVYDFCQKFFLEHQHQYSGNSDDFASPLLHGLNESKQEDLKPEPTSGSSPVDPSQTTGSTLPSRDCSFNESDSVLVRKTNGLDDALQKVAKDDPTAICGLSFSKTSEMCKSPLPVRKNGKTTKVIKSKRGVNGSDSQHNFPHMVQDCPFDQVQVKHLGSQSGVTHDVSD
jgi:hypothetical protein